MSDAKSAVCALILLAATALSGVSPARAEEMCGLETSSDGLRAAAKAGGFSSMCLALEGCAIYSAETGGHRLQLSRENARGVWIVLLSLPGGADVSEGVELIAGTGEPMRVPPEFLDERADGRAIAISAKLTDVVLEELRKAGTLRWRYVLKNGKQMEAVIPLAGLSEMLKWAGCAEKTLADAVRKKQGGGD